MAVDATPSQIATNALAGLPFSQIIGSPLKAAIEAQAMAAQTTWRFIQEVGLNTDPETGEKKAVNVSFDFIQDGKEVRLNVPLLTIVPIPYIAINTIDIAFKAKINAESSSHSETSDSSETSASGSFSAKAGWGPFSASLSASASYSSKKDSKATQDSKYSVEYTLDITVKAAQEGMPAGLARVLDILNNCIAVNNPKGELGANFTEFKDKNALIVATYKNSEGVYKPDLIKFDDKPGTLSPDGRSAVFEVPAGNAEQEIELKANDSSKKVTVPAQTQAAPA
jgi:hypothetical protein